MLYRTEISIRAQAEEEEEEEGDDEGDGKEDKEDEEEEEEEEDDDSPELRVACSADDARRIPSSKGFTLKRSISSFGVCFVISKYLSGGVRVARYLLY